jgi:hypothetical protein
MYRQSKCTDNQNAQTIKMHRQSKCTDNQNVQTIKMHRQSKCTDNQNAQTIKMHRKSKCTENQNAQTIKMHRQSKQPKHILCSVASVLVLSNRVLLLDNSNKCCTAVQATDGNTIRRVGLVAAG